MQLFLIIANDKVIFTLLVCCAGFALHKQHISFANPCASLRSVYSERQNIFDVHYNYTKNLPDFPIAQIKKPRCSPLHLRFLISTLEKSFGVFGIVS